MVRSEPFGSNAESFVVWVVRDYVVGLAQLDGRGNQRVGDRNLLMSE